MKKRTASRQSQNIRSWNVLFCREVAKIFLKQLNGVGTRKCNHIRVTALQNIEWLSSNDAQEEQKKLTLHHSITLRIKIISSAC